MTDLDWLPPADKTIVVPTPRKCRHIRTWRVFEPLPADQQVPGQPLRGASVCGQCGHRFDETKARRGKSSRRLGGDQERRIERVYGPMKIGERGDPVDHLGRVWRWQSKATRALPTLRLAAIHEPTRVVLSRAIFDAWRAMFGLYDPRRSVVIRSFVSHGVRTRDWLFVHRIDALDELGLDYEPDGLDWWAIPGDWWLDHFGRDE